MGSASLNDKDYLQRYDGPALRLMEVCGTHTAAIFKSGIRSFLSPKIKLVSGPGCPVCVTIPAYIDLAIETCLTPGNELVCFGDLLKVPGSAGTLSNAKGAGGRVRMVWSPFDALPLAEQDPETTFVIAAIGFETTVPAFGLLLEEAEAQGIQNIRLLPSLKSALTAIDWICAAGEAIDAFICPGHVSVVTGADAYLPLAKKYGKPFVVAGFESEHLLQAIKAAAEDASEGRSGVRNLYPEAVSTKGNQKALDITEKYFQRYSAEWRGLGMVSGSGYRLKDAYSKYMSKEPSICHVLTKGTSPSACRCGDVILGRIDPDECPLFRTSCTPINPIGPCMVSAEGACGTWFRSKGH